MNKQQLIDAIRKLNPTAAEKLLTLSDELDLNNYLFRLRFSTSPRDFAHTWSRPGNTPAVVSRNCKPAAT